MLYFRWEREIEKYDLTYYEINFILLEVLGRSYEDIRLKGLSREELERLKPFLEQAERIPVEYVFRKAFFRNLELYVDERVLIPRNETEQLIDIALRLAEERGVDKILEIGTGSGAIAISLAVEGGITVFANDISRDAVEVARMNILSHNVSNRVFLFVADGLRGVKPGWDLIIWNFPYVLPEEYPALPEKVKVEPPIALVSTPEKLLSFVKKALGYLNGCGYILLELSPTFIRILKGEHPDVRIEKDIYGVERFAIIQNCNPL